MNENNQQFFVRRIGRTNFKVNVFFSETEKETLEDKILRIIRRETLENGSENGIMRLPQMSRSVAWSSIMNIRQTENKITALYERLSRDDNESWFCCQSTVHRTLSWTKPRVHTRRRQQFDHQSEEIP